MANLPYGRLVSAPMIERAVEATLRVWLGQYIGEVLAQAGHPRDALPDPTDLVRASGHDWDSESAPPLAIVVSPGTTDVRRVPNGYTATWSVTAMVVASMPTRLQVREAAQFYAAALYCLEQKGIDLDGATVRWQGEELAPVRRPGDDRTQLAGQAHFAVMVEGARALHGGPADPPTPDPVTGVVPREPASTPPLPDSAFVDVTVVAGDMTP
jgi:hypothetical protein